MSQPSSSSDEAPEIPLPEVPIGPRPAARQLDATFHGGTITSGDRSVLIGGQPAARKGDEHACPIVDVKTHVGGVIVQGSKTVDIAGASAARMFDLCGCEIAGVSGTGSPTAIGPDVEYHVVENEDGTFSYSAAEYLDGTFNVGNAKIEKKDWRTKGEVSLWNANGESTDEDGDVNDLQFNSVHVEASSGLLLFHDGEHSYGFGGNASVAANFVDGKIASKRKPIPYLDAALDIFGLEAEYQSAGALSAGALGGADAHAFYDSSTEEFYLGGMISAFFFGGEVDLIFGARGSGVGGTPNLIFSGEYTVLIGG